MFELKNGFAKLVLENNVIGTIWMKHIWECSTVYCPLEFILWTLIFISALNSNHIQSDTQPIEYFRNVNAWQKKIVIMGRIFDDCKIIYKSEM